MPSPVLLVPGAILQERFRKARLVQTRVLQARGEASVALFLKARPVRILAVLVLGVTQLELHQHRRPVPTPVL